MYITKSQSCSNYQSQLLLLLIVCSRKYPYLDGRCLNIMPTPYGNPVLIINLFFKFKNLGF